jgi:hypothetical protein
MPVILAAQEAEEIRRMAVQKQPQTNSLRDPISKKRAGRVAQGVGQSLNLSTAKKKKKERKKLTLVKS